MPFRRIFLGLSALALLSLSACNNEVDVVGEWKEIPVVYGILRHTADTQFVRIEKAFLDPRTSALVVAQRPDSIYFAEEDVDVLISWRNVSNNPAAPFTFLDTMRRLDLSTIGIDKEPGIFASSPNYAYITDKPLLDSREYQVEIKSKRTNQTYKAITRGVSSYTSSDASTPFFITVPASTAFVNWSFINPITGNDEYTNQVSFRWAAPLHGRLYEMNILFHYYEFQIQEGVAGEPEVPGSRVEKVAVWKPIQNYIPENNLTQVTLPGESFYSFLRRELSPVTGTNTRRCAIDLTIEVEAANDDFAEYIRARQANEGLIGGLNPSDPYTNVQGGFGILASANKTVKSNIRLGEQSVDYIQRNPLTSNLGFRGAVCPR